MADCSPAIPCHTLAYAPLNRVEFDPLVSSANSGHRETTMTAKTYKTTPEQRERARLWKLRNPEKAKKAQRNADAKRASKKREQNRKRYLENRDSALAKQKAYYDANRESRIAYQQSEPRKAYSRKRMASLRQSQPEKVKAAKLAYHKKRLAKDPIYKLKQQHRSRLTALMNGRPKPGSAVTAWGCSDGELRVWIEGQFQSGWSWENYGKVWVVDHFFPLAWANLEDPAEFAAVWHHRNLRPLGKAENIAKGDSVCAQAQVLFNELVTGVRHV